LISESHAHGCCAATRPAAASPNVAGQELFSPETSLGRPHEAVKTSARQWEGSRQYLEGTEATDDAVLLRGLAAAGDD